MGAPPRKCAVSGMLNISPQVPPATPSIFLAIRRVTSLPTGIHVGLGSPWPCLLVSRRVPHLVRLVNVVMELSRFCMTRAIMVRSLQRRALSSRRVPRGSAEALCSSCFHRGTSVPSGPLPSVINVCSRPIALEPLP